MHTIVQDILDSLRLEASGVPIYVQLREQLQRLIHGGVLRPGAQMPTMRQVAVALKVDLNTVRHAYDALEAQGAIVLVRGRGSFVAERPATAPAADTEALDRLAVQAVALARAAGIDPQQLAGRIADLAKEGNPS